MKNFETDFVTAARTGDIEEVKKRFEQISNLETRNEQCYFSLYFASFYNKIEIVKFLLENNVDPNLTVESYLTALHGAVFKNNDDIAELLLDNGAMAEPKITLESGFVNFISLEIIYSK